MVAATLRPETMSVTFLLSCRQVWPNNIHRYGLQTNCFVGTAIKYGIFAINDKEAYLRAVRNMAFQGIIKDCGTIDQLLEIDGAKLIPEVYVLIGVSQSIKANSSPFYYSEVC